MQGLRSSERWLAEVGAQRATATALQTEYIIAVEKPVRDARGLWSGAVALGAVSAIALSIGAFIRPGEARKQEAKRKIKRRKQPK
jgi:hypothetical protein